MQCVRFIRSSVILRLFLSAGTDISAEVALISVERCVTIDLHVIRTELLSV